jgi:hypothetical protein
MLCSQDLQREGMFKEVEPQCSGRMKFLAMVVNGDAIRDALVAIVKCARVHRFPDGLSHETDFPVCATGASKVGYC